MVRGNGVEGVLTLLLGDVIVEPENIPMTLLVRYPNIDGGGWGGGGLC